MSDVHLRPRLFGLFLSLFAALMIFAIAGQSWWAISQDKRLTIDAEFEHGLVAVRLLEEHATQTLREAERNLDNVVNAILIAGREKPIDDNLIRGVLTKAQPFNRVLKALQFVNPKGQAWVSSIDYPAYQTDADDRVYIPYLLTHTDEKKPVIGKPFQRFYDAELVVPIARNVYADDGHYLGIISTDISVSYFSNVYARIAKDSHAMVSLFSNDGVIIVRFPFNPDQIGQDFSRSPVIQKIKQQTAEGMLEDNHFLDEKHNTARLYTYRKVSDFPIITVFARKLDSILAPWRDRTQNRIGFALLTMLFIAGVTWFIWRQFRRLHQSEQSLRASETYLKQSEIKFTHLFEHSPVPLALLRFNDSRILEINAQLLTQWAYSHDQVVGRSLQELNIWEKPDDALSHDNLLNEKGFVNQLEVGIRDKYRQLSTCQLSSRSFVSNNEIFVIFSPINISRLREVESEIRTLNTQLEQKVSERTLSLEQANEELQHALKTMKSMQDEMFRSEKMAALGYLVAGISHELNTPIGNSLMVASTLRDHAEALSLELNNPQPRKTRLQNLIADSEKGAHILVRNLQRAAHLILSFKQVAVDQSSDHRRVFDLKKTVEEVLLTLEPIYRRTSHQLICELAEGIGMESYPGALAQVITNAVTNAISHGFDGRENGTMRLTASMRNNSEVEIRFSDDGIGIPPQNIARVFDPFFTTKLGQGGSGLGLNIVYNLATEVLGGTIKLDSAINAGTSIILILPIFAPLKNNE